MYLVPHHIWRLCIMLSCSCEPNQQALREMSMTETIHASVTFQDVALCKALHVTPTLTCIRLFVYPLPCTLCRQAARPLTKMLSMAVQAHKLRISTTEADAEEGEGTSASDSHVGCPALPSCLPFSRCTASKPTLQLLASVTSNLVPILSCWVAGL